MVTIGVVAPGSMGAAVGDTLRRRGHHVVATAEGRSPATRDRAERAGIVLLDDLAAVVGASDVVLSIVPPGVAVEVAAEVARLARDRSPGVYVDCNAVAPSTATAVREAVTASGFEFADGGIIGGPPAEGGRTELYVSGPAGEALAPELATPELSATWIGPDATAASALKMAYAAWTKGTSALLLEIRAMARAYGVDDALVAQWERSQPDVLRRADGAPRVAGRAWRWDAEMLEIARTLEDAGLPGGAFEAASEVYRRMAGFKDTATAPSLDDVIAALRPQ